jgi:CubicO group peptidase (beta-lactamase class C family)
VQNRGIGRVIPFPMHWRLGYHRVPTLRVKVPRGFGHFGFGGSGAWADPDRNLSVAMVLNSGTGTPFGDVRMVKIGSIAARCAERR